MSEVERFQAEVDAGIREQAADADFRDLTRRWLSASLRRRYSYNFSWLGRPIIQYPQDIVAIQEIIWAVRPDLIVETGIAHGGSLILSASMLELLGGPGFVVGIDLDIRAHNREAIEEHPLFKRIQMIEGSSIDRAVVERVRALAEGRHRVCVFLDSNHTHAHVLRELELYSPLVTPGAYLVVFDTVIEEFPGAFPDRPWDQGNSPRTAVREFLSHTDRFEPDKRMDGKLLISTVPGGYLRCTR